MYVRRESEQGRKQICHQKNKDAKGLITCDVIIVSKTLFAD